MRSTPENQIIEDMAKALYKQSLKHAIAHAEEYAINTRRIDDCGKYIEGKSAETGILSIYALIDEEMKDIISFAAREGDKSDLDLLFSSNGPLSTSNNRIVFLSALGWINPKYKRCLNLLRRLRNEIAHSVDPKLNDAGRLQTFISATPELDYSVLTIEEHTGIAVDESSPYAAFLIRSILLYSHITIDGVCAPISMRLNVDVPSMLALEDKKPSNVWDFNLTISKWILEIASAAFSSSAKQLTSGNS